MAQHLLEWWRRGAMCGLCLLATACEVKPGRVEGRSDGSPGQSAQPGVLEQGKSFPSGPEVTLEKIQDAGPDVVEVYLSKKDGFHVGASRPALRIGSQLFVLSRHPESGDLTTLIFPIPRQVYAAMEDDEPIYFAERESELVLERPTAAQRKAREAVIPPGTWFLGLLKKSWLEEAASREVAK